MRWIWKRLQREYRRRIKWNIKGGRHPIGFLTRVCSIRNMVNSTYAIIPFSQMKTIAEEAGMPFDYTELNQDETIKLSHIILMSFAGQEQEDVQIGDNSYRIIKEDDTPYLGAMQEQMSIYVLNDEVYKELEPKGILLHMYNFKIEDPSNADASRTYLRSLSKTDENGQMQVGVNFSGADSDKETWIRVLYSLCIFMFVTLILAGGSIIFIKLNNDAYEDRDRYRILRKLGIAGDTLYKSMKNEIRFTYYCPFVLMAVSSWFAIRALGNVMKEDLFRVNIYSAVSILVIFTLVYLVSVRVFRGKVLDT